MDNAQSTGLLNAWIERIFERLLAMYGRKFADMWGCVDPASMRDAWANGLGDLQPSEISAGLNRCMEREWPPTLPEFRLLCRTVQSYETAHAEAAMRWPHREGWSDSANYWAAASFGRDIGIIPYSAIKTRWKDALDRARANPQPIPEPVKPEYRITDSGGLTPEQEREISLKTAARVLAQWRSMQTAAKKLGLGNREPGQDDEEAA